MCPELLWHMCTWGCVGTGARVLQVIQALNTLVGEDKSNASAKEIVTLMYDTAMLTSGFDVDSPKDYANKVYDMMGMALAGEADAPAAAPSTPPASGMRLLHFYPVMLRSCLSGTRGPCLHGYSTCHPKATFRDAGVCGAWYRS